MDVLRLLAFLLRLVVSLTVTTVRLSWKIAALVLRKAGIIEEPGSHGSARWATWWDLVRGGAWGRNRGLIVGKLYGRFIRYRRDGTTLVRAAAGKGKGVSVIIPNLLDYPGAIFCSDPKGENHAITQRWRSTLGPVYRLNAINANFSHRFNPFDLIRRGTPHEADDCAMIADLLVTPSGAEDTHWDKSARALLASLIQHVVTAFDKPVQTLATVRHLVASEGETFAEVLRDMASSAIASVAEAGRDALGSLGSEEMTSVKKNAALNMLIFSKDRIGGLLTSASDFDLIDLHRRVMTVYVMIPEDALAVYAPLLRLLVGSATVAMVRGKHLPRPKYKPLFLIDECAALGRLDLLTQFLAIGREYAHTLLVFQDSGQIKTRYGNDGARTYMAASGCQVTFGVSDFDTARELADSIGRTTVYSHSEGSSETAAGLRRHQQTGAAETGRYLLDPAEIRRLPSDRAVVFLQDQVRAPVLVRKVKYYKERCWRGRYDAWRTSSDGEPQAASASLGIDPQG